MLGCDGNRDIQTPNIDLLAKEGTRFGSNFVCAPQSEPSRATLFTGRVRGLQTKTTLFDMLTAQGYNAGYAGAWQSGDRPADSVTGKAHQFLDQQSKDKPFLLTVSYADPHPPYDGHARKYDEMYAKSTLRTWARASLAERRRRQGHAEGCRRLAAKMRGGDQRTHAADSVVVQIARPRTA
jgi:arylsulfatase A-like enzyme